MANNSYLISQIVVALLNLIWAVCFLYHILREKHLDRTILLPNQTKNGFQTLPSRTARTKTMAGGVGPISSSSGALPAIIRVLGFSGAVLMVSFVVVFFFMLCSRVGGVFVGLRLCLRHLSAFCVVLVL